MEQPSCTSAAPFVISMHHLFLQTQIILHKAVVMLLPVPTISSTLHIPLHTCSQKSLAIRAFKWGLSKHPDGRCAGQNRKFLVVFAEKPSTQPGTTGFSFYNIPLRYLDVACKEEPCQEGRETTISEENFTHKKRTKSKIWVPVTETTRK